MTIVAAPVLAAGRAGDPLHRQLAQLRVRARRAAAELADIRARLAALEQQIRERQQR